MGYKTASMATQSINTPQVDGVAHKKDAIHPLQARSLIDLRKTKRKQHSLSMQDHHEYCYV